MWSCIEVVLKLVCNLSKKIYDIRRPSYIPSDEGVILKTEK